jgi:putative two-component system response regulator
MEEAIKSKLQRIASEMRERSSSGEPSRDFYLKSLDWVTDIHSPQFLALRLRCVQECGKYFYLLGDKQPMLKAVAAFEHLAIKSGQKEWLRKALSMRGVAHADVGDFNEALVCYSKALRIAHELGNTFDEAAVLVNIGYALLMAGLYTDAMRALERAFDLGNTERHLSRFGSIAAINIAQILSRQGRHQEGVRYISRALELQTGLSAAEYNQDRVVLEFNYVQLAVGLRDARLADQRLSICEEFARKAGTTRASLIVAVARGLREVDHGDPAIGVNILRSVILGTDAMTDQWVDAQIYLIRGLEKIGAVEDALQCVETLSAALSQSYLSSIQVLAQDNSFANALKSDELATLAGQRSRLQLLAANRHIARMKWEAIERLALTAQLKDDSTGLHGHRVGRLSRLFAERLHLNPGVVDAIEVAGRLHDIGKIAIPERALRASANPSEAEQELLNAHARMGADLLSQSAIPELQCAEIVARHHHERWDGHGYPSRMAGRRIPAECRIVAIADYFDALTHGRPNARPLSAPVALAEIGLQAGKRFDPQLTEHFSAFMRELLSTHRNVALYLQQGARASPFSDAMRELSLLISEMPRSARDNRRSRGISRPSRVESRP